MSWTEAKGCITGYKVHCIDDISGFDHSRQLKPSELSYIIQDLRPGTSYTISVSGLYGEEESQAIPIGGISLKTKGSQLIGLPLETEPGMFLCTGILVQHLIPDSYPIAIMMKATNIYNFTLLDSRMRKKRKVTW